MRILLILFMSVALASAAYAQPHAEAHDDHAPATHVEHDAHGADVHADAHGEQASPSVFAGTIAQSVAAVLVFLILLAVLYKLAWNPILSGLQERESKIRGDLESAERSAHQAEATLKEYQQRVASANEEVRKLIEKGRADAQLVASQLKEQMERDIAQARQRAEAEIGAARQQAVAELYAQAATLATDVAGRILKRQINPADQQQLVNEAVGELRNAAGRN